MKKELPSKFRFKANGFYYLAELSTQAAVYNLSSTDVNAKDIRNLNRQVLKEVVQSHVKSGHWKIIEEPFELPSKFTFVVSGTIYTAIEQEDKNYMVYWKNSCGMFDKYGYIRESVKDHLEEHWTIEKEVDMSVVPSEVISTPEPTLLDVIKEFVDTTKSEVTILPQGKWNVSCSFLSDDVVVDNEDELKQLLAATSSIIKLAVGKMANGNKK